MNAVNQLFYSTGDKLARDQAYSAAMANASALHPGNQSMGTHSTR